MKDEVGVLLAKFSEHRIQARQHETLRGTLTTLTLAIAGGVLALAGNSTALPEFQLAGAVLLILLGVFGAALAAKHYERFRYHSSLASAYDKLVRERVKSSDLANFPVLKSRHNRRFWLSSWLRANVLWTSLLVCVALLGLALAALTFPRYCATTTRPEWTQWMCRK